MTEACSKLDRAIEEARWGATKRIIQLRVAQSQISTLEHSIDSSKSIEEARWGGAKKIVWLHNEIRMALE